MQKMQKMQKVLQEEEWVDAIRLRLIPDHNRTPFLMWPRLILAATLCLLAPQTQSDSDSETIISATTVFKPYFLLCLFHTSLSYNLLCFLHRAVTQRQSAQVCGFFKNFDWGCISVFNIVVGLSRSGLFFSVCSKVGAHKSPPPFSVSGVIKWAEASICDVTHGPHLTFSCTCVHLCSCLLLTHTEVLIWTREGFHRITFTLP